MAVTFAQSLAGMDEVAERINQDRKRLIRGRQEVTTAKADLAGLPSNYAAIITAIEDAVTAAPTDAEWLALQGVKDKLVAEFQALKTTATDMETALAGYDL